MLDTPPTPDPSPCVCDHVRPHTHDAFGRIVGRSPEIVAREAHARRSTVGRLRADDAYDRGPRAEGV